MAQAEKQKRNFFSPFLDHVALSKHDSFDQYYEQVEYREIYRKAGVDKDGVEYGIPEIKPIIKKVSIAELLTAEAQSVGVEAYMRALAVQGDSIENYNTVVEAEHIVDYSKLPQCLVDVMTLGDKAKEAFSKLDPSLRGEHTTIDGFLNSLTSEKIDSYLKGKIDAIFPKKADSKGGE